MTSEGAEPRAVGTIIHGRYRILRIVGRGGLGTVYQVADVVYGANAIFALKELADTNPGARKQFELESQWLRELNHDSIPKVREAFEWDGREYLVMDFVDGENLEQYMRRTGRPLPEGQALRWMLPICDALHYLHTRMPPLLHRDVKPANIIVTPGGHPVLVDFGIAKAHLPGMNQTVTFVRKAGTEGYAPPEQYAATGMTGPWSDVYALGATLYQLLTGRLPRTAVERITEMEPMPRPRELVPSLSPLTDQAIMRALDLKPAARYPSVIELAGALTESLRVLGGLGSVGTAPATPLSPMPPLSPMSPRSSVSLPGSSFPTGAGSFPPSPPPAPQSMQRTREPLPSLGEPLPSNLAGQAGQGALAVAPRSPAPSSFPPSPLSAASLSDPQVTARSGGLRGAQPDVSPRSPAPSQPRSRAPVFIALIAIVLVAVAGGAYYAYNSFATLDRSTPQASVTGYFRALRAQDYATAWRYDANSRNNPNTQADFTQSLQADDASYGVVRSANITQVEMVTSSQALVTASTLRGNSQSPMIYTLQLTEYDGSVWLIVTVGNQ
jgi:eukaryotic-like serine/threonine-protein kinase